MPQADPPAHDELLFITVHQVYELWFQQLLYELEAVRDAMIAGETWRARHLLRRVHAIERLLIAQVDILETMTPQDFLEFRASLAPASGFQSVQFRELEFLSGLKDQAFLARFRSISAAQRDRLARRLAEPSLWDAYLHLLASRGLPAGTDQQILESLRVVAGDRAAHDDLWQLAEGPAHPRRAGRTLAGAARGDGGTADRHEVRHRWVDRCAVPAQASAAAVLPAAVGAAGPAVGTGRRIRCRKSAAEIADTLAWRRRRRPPRRRWRGRRSASAT